MSIKELTIALGGKMQGAQGRAPCPNCQPPKHPNPSLSIAFESQGQDLLIYCFKGCTFDDLRPNIDAVNSGGFEWDRNEYEQHA